MRYDECLLSRVSASVNHRDKQHQLSDASRLPDRETNKKKDLNEKGKTKCIFKNSLIYIFKIKNI